MSFDPHPSKQDTPLITSRCEVQLTGGPTAPRRARHWARSQVASGTAAVADDDLDLLVSELVTHSVVHAQVDESRQLTVTLEVSPSRLRIIVTDPGSEAGPQIARRDGFAPGGSGLFLVGRLSVAWGRGRDQAGAHVWCELPIE